MGLLMTNHALWRMATSSGIRLGRGEASEGPRELLPLGLDVDDLLAGPPGALRAALDGPADGKVDEPVRILAPVSSQEVWAAGVTYEDSRRARNEESGNPDIYDEVYQAERPELFLKAVPGRVCGPREAIGIRFDSGWDVPEPELTVVADARGAAVAYTIGNDVSSRRIEGENPLYLPQAKIYSNSCSIGPCLVPVEQAPNWADITIELTISRNGERLFSGSVPVSRMRRTPAELLSWLYRGLDFPRGALLMTGTSIVPPPDITLRPGDEVAIAISGLGTLTNPVKVVGDSDRGR